MEKKNFKKNLSFDKETWNNEISVFFLLWEHGGEQTSPKYIVEAMKLSFVFFFKPWKWHWYLKEN